MAGYVYDVFISYKRSEVGKIWVPKYFFPCFEFELSQCLGRPAKVFLDTGDIQAGSKLPKALGQALATSKCIVPVFCGLYFGSEWCAREYAIMHHREVSCDVAPIQDPLGIIVPILVRDGEHLPPIVEDVLYDSMEDHFTKSNAFAESPGFLDFEKDVRRFAKKVSNSLKKAPTWDLEWFEDKWLDGVEIDQYYRPNGNSIDQNPILT